MKFNVNERWLRTGGGTMYDKTADVNLAKATILFKSLSPSFQGCSIVLLNALADLDKTQELSGRLTVFLLFW